MTINDSKMTIGERIQKKRKELDLSAEELSALTKLFDFSEINGSESGISLPTIYRYEKGEREPASREILLLCESLNVSPNWLLLGSEWNSSQEEDSKMAEALRALIGLVKSYESMPNRNVSRNEMHHFKLTEIKAKRGK